MVSENVTKNKEEYIEAWDSHINDFNILSFCKDKNLSEQVKIVQETLKELVRKIAETKDLN